MKRKSSFLAFWGPAQGFSTTGKKRQFLELFLLRHNFCMFWGQFLALNRVCWSKVNFESQKWTGWPQTHDFGPILSVFHEFGAILSTFDFQNSLLTNKLDSAQKFDPKPYTDPKVDSECFRSHLGLTFDLGSLRSSKPQKWPITICFRLRWKKFCPGKSSWISDLEPRENLKIIKNAFADTKPGKVNFGPKSEFGHFCDLAEAPPRSCVIRLRWNFSEGFSLP